MTFDEILAARRSVRKYTDEAVSDGDLSAVLQAGRLAPSAKNEQRWHFTAVKDAATRERLVAACKGQGMVGEAPVDLVIWAENDRLMGCGQSTASIDCAIALSFMMLKATELGLGTCWLGAFSAPEVKDILALPQEAIVVAVMPLGHPAESPAPRPRKALEEIAEIRE